MSGTLFAFSTRFHRIFVLVDVFSPQRPPSKEKPRMGRILSNYANIRKDGSL
jgi:hypothetical protein